MLHICDGCTQVEIGKGYGRAEWREDLRRLLHRAGVAGTPTMFLLSDTQIRDEAFIEDINHLLNAGEVPNLFVQEDRIQARRGCCTGRWGKVCAYCVIVTSNTSTTPLFLVSPSVLIVADPMHLSDSGSRSTNGGTSWCTDTAAAMEQLCSSLPLQHAHSIVP